jgi:hypothetical protein
VIGDRRLLRFLRGKLNDVDEACRCMAKMLNWRKENQIDVIRQDIVYGGKNAPRLFPKGEQILHLVPQIIIEDNALDAEGRPLSLESYNFDPDELLKEISINDYLKFLIYTLEYRTLVMEELGERRERAYLMNTPPENRTDGYGVLLYNYTIRDLEGNCITV